MRVNRPRSRSDHSSSRSSCENDVEVCGYNDDSSAATTAVTAAASPGPAGTTAKPSIGFARYVMRVRLAAATFRDRAAARGEARVVVLEGGGRVPPPPVARTVRRL